MKPSRLTDPWWANATAEQRRTIQKGCAEEHLRGVCWTSPIRARMASQSYDHQRAFVLASAIAFFESGLFKANLKNLRLPQWFTDSSRKRRRKIWRRTQHQVK